MNKRDYYTILGLTQSCTPQEIRQSFHRLALKWHPDKCLDKNEAQLKFNEIHEAYSVLSDERKKKIYDECGHEGLKIDENYRDFANQNGENTFFQKGFQGTSKSAFDILRDIFEENDDDYFFQNYNDFGISDTLKSTVRAFVEDNLFTTEPEPSSNFFESYKPTFMNPTFFMPPPTFGDFNVEETYTTSFFSFLSSNTGDQTFSKTFSRTSSTVMKDGKIKTTTKESFQDGNNFYETEERTDYVNQKRSTSKHTNNTIYDSIYTQNAKNASIIIVNDDDESESPFSESINSATDKYICLEELGNKINCGTKMTGASKKISKNKESLHIRLTKKKPSKKCKT